MAHPSGLTGVHLRPNTLDGKAVFILVDYGDAGTLTSPKILRTMTASETNEFLNRMYAMGDAVAAATVAEVIFHGGP